ncbi:MULTISPECIES: hypothetical protein [Pseudoalteromonas]|uniref:Uncharacterized protein n=1 Tax=Pseudoalteromonas luteoviolacea (strain 2ta16) TaxID=1353533 RepID=V4JD06_PSEL2|nr:MULTISPECIES: hypothetical protein [Pseudoalteromonas]ESP92957.1 hypothetical protein PL2TA16_03589 [Pseudoalteromonas luteoviolacea 2ta16]KZN43229.1 hypothetical protein N483_09930 [Pseudoalteromonas luteoviolacea NCIMB 1944]MCG7549394.1 hypothetical protein [Pseudoalteromonas sp. Of7M-16]
MEIFITIFVLLIPIVLAAIYIVYIQMSTRNKVRLADSIIYMIKHDEPVNIDMEILEGLKLSPKEKSYLLNVYKAPAKLHK